MNGALRRLVLLAITAVGFVVISGCGARSVTTSSGPILVQLTQVPTVIVAGTQTGLVATVSNDKNNQGVQWSCAPAGACGTFSPGMTAYQIDTLYTAPIAPEANGPITANLNSYSVTITATSVADSSKSASVTIPIAQQYAIVLQGYASFGLVGSITIDGNGNIIDGEAEASANGFYTTIGRLNTSSKTTNHGPLTGTYTIDSTGHGSLTLNLNTSCCGTFTETHSITATSNSHVVIAEIDQFNGLTIGGVGSMDLQTAGPNFSAAQLNGGYSFEMTGFSGPVVKANKETGLNGSLAGVFTADGVSGITNGIFDSNFAGGATPYTSTPFAGSFTAPDAYGHGQITFNGINGSTPLNYSYYMVTPEVLRVTAGDSPTASFAGVTGSAFGQGSVGTTDAALDGSYIFSELGFDVPGNAMGAAGQLTTNGQGAITAGLMDVNDSANSVLLVGQPLAGSTYSFSGTPRGTVTTPSGTTWNVYLTDPNLNLLDPNNTSGTGGALLLETDVTYSAIGLAIPQPSPASAAVAGNYALLLTDQNNPPMSDGGFTGSLAASSGAFSGEGDFQTTNTVDPVTGPVSGTYTADSANPGHYTATITTTPAFPTGAPGGAAGTEDVSIYVANDSQAFIVETDNVAPITGVLELQPLSDLTPGIRERIRQQVRSAKRSSGPLVPAKQQR
jgi:hypothetical protein